MRLRLHQQRGRPGQGYHAMIIPWPIQLPHTGRWLWFTKVNAERQSGCESHNTRKGDRPRRTLPDNGPLEAGYPQQRGRDPRHVARRETCPTFAQHIDTHGPGRCPRALFF